MALIPTTYKLSWYDPSKPGGVITAQNDNVNITTSAATQYTMQDVIDTVIAGGSTPGINDRLAVYQETSPGQFTLAPSAASVTYPSVAGANYMILRDAYSMVLSREPGAAGGDPEYIIVDENFGYRVSFGYDDDGGNFGYLYNWNAGDWKIGSTTQNPTLTIKSSVVNGGIEIDGGILFNQNLAAYADDAAAGAAGVATGTLYQTDGSDPSLPVAGVVMIKQ